MEKECKKHGLTEHSQCNRGYWRCRKCRVEAVQRRRDKIKTMAVEYKGSSCKICGYDKYVGALDFHHLDPSKKDFGIAKSGKTRSWERVKEELDKCIMVCKNCHAEIHNGVYPIGKGADC